MDIVREKSRGGICAKRNDGHEVEILKADFNGCSLRFTAQRIYISARSLI